MYQNFFGNLFLFKVKVKELKLKYGDHFFENFKTLNLKVKSSKLKP